jgi:hypothetical protein
MYTNSFFRLQKNTNYIKWISIFILLSLFLNLTVYYEAQIKKSSNNSLIIVEDVIFIDQTDSIQTEKTTNRLRVFNLKSINIQNFEISFKNLLYYLYTTNTLVNLSLFFLEVLSARAP